ncbi:MAG: YraN family protein [Candidatus Gallimonas sp.]
MHDSPKDVRAKVLGRRGEALVCKYLKKRGYRILERNYRTPFGEADLVAQKDDEIVFVEVKARESDAFGLPVEAVTRAKQRRYFDIAKYYCLGLGKEAPVRFDVASVWEGEIEYFENAFP